MADTPDKPTGEVLSSLPSRRPQRPSARREGAKRSGGGAKGSRRASGGAKTGGAKASRSRSGRAKAGPKAARPAGVRPSAATRAASRPPADRPAETPQGVELVGTALQAAGELAQLGLSLGTRALAGAVKRLPRP